MSDHGEGTVERISPSACLPSARLLEAGGSARRPGEGGAREAPAPYGPAPSHAWPKITVITPVLNGRRYVGAAIESVRAQHYAHVEHIVIDAGSTDGTLEVLARYPHLRVIAEPDEGPHDAMNKGIRHAKGEVIGFLNADDEYVGNLLTEVALLFRASPELEALCGASLVLEEAEGGARRPIARLDLPVEGGLALDVLTLGSPAFNARFFRRRLFDRVGLFDNRYRIAADRDFLIRARLAGVRSQAMPRVVYLYRQHEGSRTLDPSRRARIEIAREHVRMVAAYLSSASLTPCARRHLRRLHAFETLKLVLHGIRRGRWGLSARSLAAAVRLNTLWPWTMAAALLARRRLARDQLRLAGGAARLRAGAQARLDVDSGRDLSSGAWVQNQRRRMG